MSKENVSAYVSQLQLVDNFAERFCRGWSHDIINHKGRWHWILPRALEWLATALPAALGPALHKFVLTKHPVVVILYVILHVNVTRSAEDTINNNVNWNKCPMKNVGFNDQCVELVGFCQQLKLTCMKISYERRELYSWNLSNIFGESATKTIQLWFLCHTCQVLYCNSVKEINDFFLLVSVLHLFPIYFYWIKLTFTVFIRQQNKI